MKPVAKFPVKKIKRKTRTGVRYVKSVPLSAHQRIVRTVKNDLKRARSRLWQTMDEVVPTDGKAMTFFILAMLPEAIEGIMHAMTKREWMVLPLRCMYSGLFAIKALNSKKLRK